MVRVSGPFAYMSRRPGIGSRYLDVFKKWQRDGLKNYAQVGKFKFRLPRFYKDRMFTSLEKEMLRVESVNARDVALFKELERLGKFHRDPIGYYNERVLHLHESISKSVRKGKF